MADALTTDTQRIARGLRKRDIALLHQLVDQYHFRLVRYLIYLLGRRDAVVDDLVQETWLRVLERGRSYDGRSRFEPWLFTIARNLTVDHLRKRRIVSLDSASDSSPDFSNRSKKDQSPSLASSAPSPFELAARTEEAHRIAHTLQTLEPIYREALVLRFQEELSLQEISAVMGVPLTTVSSRIYRGLATLRAQMASLRSEIEGDNDAD